MSLAMDTPVSVFASPVGHDGILDDGNTVKLRGWCSEEGQPIAQTSAGHQVGPRCSRRPDLRLADQLRSRLPQASSAGPHLRWTHDGDPWPHWYPGLRLAGMCLACLGPQGPVLLPPKGRLRVGRSVRRRVQCPFGQR